MRTDISAINAKTISVNQVPIAGSATPTTGLYTTFDQLDADMTLYLAGALIQGAPYPAQIITNYENINVLSGVGLADVVKYGTYSTTASANGTGPTGAIGNGVSSLALLSPIDSRVLLSPIDGRILLRAA